MNTPSPNRKYDHVYAIARFDSYAWDESDPQKAWTITKVLWSEEQADVEATRLNALNQDKGAMYFVFLTRLERRGE